MDMFVLMMKELQVDIEARLRRVENERRKLIGEIEAEEKRQAELEKMIEGQESGEAWTLYQTMPDEELMLNAKINIWEIEKRVAFLKGRLSALGDDQRELEFMKIKFVGC